MAELEYNQLRTAGGDGRSLITCRPPLVPRLPPGNARYRSSASDNVRIRVGAAVMSDPRQPSLFAAEPEPLPWEIAAEANEPVARVVFDRPLDSEYLYRIPHELLHLVGPAVRVRVPFGRGNQLTTGFCVGLQQSGGTGRRLKLVKEVLDSRPLLTSEMLELTQWIATRYLAGWGQVLNAVIPAAVKKLAGTREITCYHPAATVCDSLDSLKVSTKQRVLLSALCSAGRPLTAAELSNAGECGVSPIRTLEKKGLIVPERRRTAPSAVDLPPAEREPDLKLNRDQREALDVILKLLRAQEHQTVLLYGVTGSGKTEVYIQAIREVVEYGRQAIVLVPEISLTPQTIRRFRSRFSSVAVLHSHLSDAERHWHWEQISRGEVQVVVGARSAVFAPTPHLGLIVIDEEHETTFKQQTTPRYHAREVARERARQEGVPLVLGSATPTLESLLRVKQKQDVFAALPDRVEKRPLPPVVVVDTRNDPYIGRGRSLGRALETAMRRALSDEGQIILFLNLRGFSTMLWCHSCAAGVKCPSCDVTLTWHKDRQRVLCHSCEFSAPKPRECLHCGTPGLRYLGSGTQRLEEEVRSRFPDNTVVRMDSDSMRKPGSHDAALDAFRHGKVDILLGTQMIAKGLDFPNVTLVGVVDADSILHQPDMRAAERTFQLIAQVAGRTGRGEKGGRVIVQTSCPDEPVIQSASRHDFYGFAGQELKNRRELNLPPYAHLARIILRGPVEETVQREARRICDELRKAIETGGADVKVVGPAPAPLVKLRQHFRYHCRLQATQIEEIRNLWGTFSPKIRLESDVELTIDVDPLDMR